MLQAAPQFPSLAGQGAIAVDVETCDPDLKNTGSKLYRGGAFVAGVAVGTEAGFREYYPVAHEAGENLPKAKVFSWLKRELKRKVPKIGAHLLYDLGFLAKEGIEVEGPFYDVQIAEPLLDENKYTYSLESISKEHLGHGKNDEELDAYLVEKFGKKNPKNNIWRAPGHVVRPYAISDVDYPIKIFHKQKAELERQGLWHLFVMESKLIPMLHEMRKRGVRIDVPATEKMLRELTKRQQKLLAEIKRQTGIEVQIWAGDSVAQVFDYLGLEYPLTPKTKKPSFKAGFMEALDHPVVQMILEARQLDKLCGTFLRGSLLEAHTDGVVHGNFNQLKSDDGGTVTGRFSSSDPNLQFIPVRTEDGKKIRMLFLPDHGQDWWKIDYSQVEYRLIVHDAASMRLRGSQEVVDIYNSDENADFHQIIADMTGLDRARAKAINFGLAYGEGVAKLAGQLHLTIDEAEALLREYHRKAPFIRPLSQALMGMANIKGEVETLMRRKRRFNKWEIWDRREKKKVIVPHRVAGARRAFTHAALNARIQGSAADIMKKAMVDVWESGVCSILGVPQLTVHDELDGSCPKTRIGRQAVKEVARIMSSAVKLLVPLKTDVGIGPNWGMVK